MGTIFRIHEWTIHSERNVLCRRDEEVLIEPRVMRVLVQLVDRANEVVSKDDLIRAVWEGAAIHDEALTNAVWELRKALGDDARNPRFIRTVSKRAIV